MITMPEGITLQMLKEKHDLATTHYTKAMKKARLLDGADRGRLWEVIGAKFPKYQILTDSNHTAYIKNNLLASIYSVGKVANIVPTSENDKDIVTQLNVALESAWKTTRAGYYQMLAGERAALLNLGVTHVGWDNKVKKGNENTNTFVKGDIKFKNINPLKYRRDPFADDLENSEFAYYWEKLHESVIKADPRYKDEMKEFLINKGGSTSSTTTQSIAGDIPGKENSSEQGYYKLFIFWLRHEGKVYEFHTIDFTHVLYMVDELKPNDIPIAELYCNVPAGDVIGTSEPSKVFANSLAYNLMNSILLTAEYKNQRPPRFINSQSGLNVNAFKKFGNEADYTFVVNGKASDAVHYHQFPQPSPQLPVLMGMAAGDIKNLSGVDDRYTGRDTGSIITTGGTEAMLDQVTLIDAPKVENYNQYTQRLTRLVLTNLIEFSHARKYFTKNQAKGSWDTIEVKFPEIDVDTVFDYEIDISSELPKNKQRIAQAATVLMEKQMQYGQAAGGGVDFITPEEWLMFQDLPFKEFMTERMGIQRTQDYIEQVSQTVFQYAELTNNGMDPEQALLATANTIEQQQRPQQQQPQVNPEQVIPGPGQGMPPL